MPQATLIFVPSPEVLRWLPQNTPQFCVSYCRIDCGYYSSSNRVLHIEYLCVFPVITLRPNMVADLRVNKLRRYANTSSFATYATLQYISYSKFATNLSHIHRSTAIG